MGWPLADIQRPWGMKVTNQAAPDPRGPMSPTATRNAPATRRLVSLPEAAEILAVSVKTVRRYIAAGDLGKRIREAAGAPYNEYVGRVATLTGRNWPVEDVQPLGTRTVAYAVCSSVRDLAESPSTKGRLRIALAKHLIQPCATVLADANAFLIEQGIEPSVGNGRHTGSRWSENSQTLRGARSNREGIWARLAF